MLNRPYPRYKASGVDWLGDIPDHWSPIRLKWTAILYTGGTPDRLTESYWEQGTIPWINSGAVNQAVIKEPSAFITEEGFRNSSAKWVPKGALVMALAGQGKTKGTVAQTAIRTTCNQSMAAIVPRASMNSRFLHWLLVTQYEHIRNMAGGEQRDGLNLDILGSIACLALPLDEQCVIAGFLDRKIAEIDGLAARKRELIDRLREKRAAIISHTVNRGLPGRAARLAGLSPNPELKWSGVAWLGQIPKHWGGSKLKFAAARIVDCPHETPAYTPGADYAVIRTADLSMGRLDLTDSLRVDEEGYLRRIRRERLEVGDIVYGREGERWGFAATVPDRPIACLGQRMMQFRASAEFDSRFLMWHLNADCVYQQGAIDALGSTSPHVNVQTIRDYWLAKPPIGEQRAISNYLNTATGSIDRMLGKIESAIERLMEYRAALITAAVTGKIDVREKLVDNRRESAIVTVPWLNKALT